MGLISALTTLFLTGWMGVSIMGWAETDVGVSTLSLSVAGCKIVRCQCWDPSACNIAPVLMMDINKPTIGFFICLV